MPSVFLWSLLRSLLPLSLLMVSVALLLLLLWMDGVGIANAAEFVVVVAQLLAVCLRLRFRVALVDGVVLVVSDRLDGLWRCRC